MSSSAEAALQLAIYTALKANVALMARVNDVYDFVPESIEEPYLVIGDGNATPFDTKDSAGQDHLITIHTWSKSQGAKETKEIMELVYSVLHNGALTVAGHQTVLCQYDFSTVLKDPDGFTHHGVQRFRVLTEDN